MPGRWLRRTNRCDLRGLETVKFLIQVSSSYGRREFGLSAKCELIQVKCNMEKDTNGELSPCRQILGRAY